MTQNRKGIERKSRGRPLTTEEAERLRKKRALIEAERPELMAIAKRVRDDYERRIGR